jgi:hypothetical protein
MNEPQPFPPSPPTSTAADTKLSITSLVLGILSMVCLSVFAGIPAIITGHMARGRAKREPERYGGAGMALGGLILGYLSVAMLLVLIPLSAALLLPALAQAKGKSQTVACVNNMKQIGLAVRIWSNDNGGVYPPNIASLSNELVRPNILICPGDKAKTPATEWSQIDPSQNVSYEYLLPGAKEAESSQEILLQCPIHGNTGLGDGSVQQGSGRRRRN